MEGKTILAIVFLVPYFIFLVFCWWYFPFIKLQNNEGEFEYKTYAVNNGKDMMVTLPSGIGINAKMTIKEANYLITIPKAEVSWHAAEIREYILQRDKKQERKQ